MTLPWCPLCKYGHLTCGHGTSNSHKWICAWILIDTRQGCFSSVPSFSFIIVCCGAFCPYQWGRPDLHHTERSEWPLRNACTSQYTERVSWHKWSQWEIQAVIAHSTQLLRVSVPQSQLKTSEPTCLAVQQVEDGCAHQPVSTVQHHSKTQANSLSTPRGLFLVPRTDPGGDRATVKGAGGSKNRPHTGHIKMADMDPGGH